MELFPDISGGGAQGFGAAPAPAAPARWYQGQHGMVPQLRQEPPRREQRPEALAAAAAAAAAAGAEAAAPQPKSSSGTDTAYPQQQQQQQRGERQGSGRPRRQAAAKRTYSLSDLEDSEADWTLSCSSAAATASARRGAAARSCARPRAVSAPRRATCTAPHRAAARTGRATPARR
jgi:hypothetical protein